MGAQAYRVDSAYRDALEAYIGKLRKAGASIHEVSLLVDPLDSYETYLEAQQA
jgi:Asp-tRNA(Asn)/Glu-tRNA(Gln) amidotransferase A subunit family amidase